MTGARPCPGPHGRGEPPITAEPMCRHCVAELVTTIERLPEQYIAAYLALEPGQRTHEDGGRARGKGAEAPLPLDVEADALMRRILEVVLSWWEAVVVAAALSTDPRPRSVVTERRASRRVEVTTATAYPRLKGETEGGRFAELVPVNALEAVDRPSDSTSGVAITTACRTLAAHVDTLLRIDAWPMTRTVERRQIPLMAAGVPCTIMADGRALIVADLTGIAGALEILALRRDAERTLGHSRRSTQLERPCPGCGEPELHLTEGQDHVKCWSCGERWDASDYPRLAAVLAVGEAS